MSPIHINFKTNKNEKFRRIKKRFKKVLVGQW